MEDNILPLMLMVYGSDELSLLNKFTTPFNPGNKERAV
jgi:hypothetical protein